MNTQLLFYTNAVPVNPANHKELYIKSGSDFAFAKSASSVPLTAAEFPLAASEYAIVFAGNDETVFPVVILGGKKDQNLYVDDAGKWNARYIPAFVRRYPFIFSQTGTDNQLALCIDEGFSGCNTAGRGERLFDSEGERTAYLEQVLNFLKSYQAQHQRTLAFCAKLKELDLLQPVNAMLNRQSGEQHVLSGLRVINRARLKELGDDKIGGMLRSDELETIFLHLHSLGNLRVIGERMPGAAEDTAPGIETENGGDTTTSQEDDSVVSH
ncbi:MAG: SapC family protein [Gammaproteobacteria bacterium]|nr:SapC family protein [Gammaproteobacteria bacterium]